MANVDITIRTIDQSKAGMASAITNAKNLAGAMGVLTTAITIAKGVFEFSKEGAALQRLADAGKEVARQYGGNMDEIIAKVKEASLGTVSEMDIIASANRAMMLGLGADAEQLANLMEIAAFRGRAMGVDTTKAFSDIVTGIGRASPLILDNLGIVINAKETYEKYAEGIGKSAGELTKAEKTQAIFNAVLAEGNNLLSEAGGLALDNAGKVEKMEAAWKDFTDNRKRENMDLAGSFSEAAANAIEGWDQFFIFLDNQGQITKRAQELRDNLDPTGDWRDYYETARIEWAAQKQAIEEATGAVEAHSEAAQIAAEELSLLSEANAKIIDGAIDITEANRKQEDSQQAIIDKIADLKAEAEKYYPWEVEKIQENIDKQKELQDEYDQSAEDFIASIEKKLAMAAVEALQWEDGVEGYNEAERQKAQAILETTDTATAAAFEQAQAQQMLIDGLIDAGVKGEDFGRILGEVSADGVISIGEVEAALNNLPKEIPISILITTTGMPSNLDPTGTGAKGTHRSPHASGGSFMIPTSYGNEGFLLGNGDTASGGEKLTITPRGGSLDDRRVVELLERIAAKPVITESMLSQVMRDTVLREIR